MECKPCHEPLIKNITGLQFSIMGPDEIKKNSVVEITKFDTYDKDIPVVKGLFDIRMGTIDMNKICGTCSQDNIKCPGHFGHIELAYPVYHWQFINHIKKILECTCIQCSKLLINKDLVNHKYIHGLSNKERWDEITSLSQKIVRCGQETINGCGAIQPSKYKIEGIEGIYAIWNNLNNDQDEKIKRQYMRVENVKEIFEKITDEDVNYMGLSDLWCRPEWLICSIFPVPPPCVRPSVKQDDSQRMDDDLTHKLSDIVRHNNNLKDVISSNNKTNMVDDYKKLVQYHVATIVNNEIPGITTSVHRSGRPIKSILQRLKGKDGRIRNNLMGKRVDYSGRSVITPDPNIELDQLGVPEKIAKNLTYPEIVNQYNIKILNKLLANDIDTYPCIKIIEKSNKFKKILTVRNKNDIQLEYGDIVHRSLLDGDYVLFNRQPSLHKMSMMGHRVVVMKADTFRLNISVTPPYNADFDGDEMNMHVPQSISAVCELINLASVNHQIISPRTNDPIITIVQDTLLGINKLTKGELVESLNINKDMLYNSNNTNIYHIKKDEGVVDENNIKRDVFDTSYFTKHQIMNIIIKLSVFNGILPENSKEINGVKFWTGKDLFSYILPNNINLVMNNNLFENEKEKYNEKENRYLNKVEIINGKLISGGLDKKMFTAASKGLIHVIYNDLGYQRTNEFINDLQNIVTEFLLIEGFSVGIGDMIADDNTNETIQNKIQENKHKINEITQEIHLNIFENFSGQTNNDYFESKVNSLLNNTIKQTSDISLSNLDQKNRITNMVNSGSKGKDINISQIIACLGQQNVDGKRIPYGYIDRTLPHYHKYDDSSEARGFVENSFISGQTPQEYFFHAMGGREGLIDTAVKTSETGYIQRKLIKSMEDLRVDYDYSVRNSSGSIIQFIYGEDGMDSCSIEEQSIDIMNLNQEEICKKFAFTNDILKHNLNKNISESLLKNSNVIDELNKLIIDVFEYKEYLYKIIDVNLNEETQVCLNKSIITYPIHIKRIVQNFTSKQGLSDISPFDIIKKNNQLKEDLYITDHYQNNKILHILIDIHLHPKILIQNYKIKSSEYDLIIVEIKKRFYKSRINPGEMVGPIAAQSIGEPATQMTLNTFHFAGVSAKSNITRGIPRLIEILHVSKNIKSPSIMIFLKEEYAFDRNKVQFVKNKLESTKLKDIVIKSQIYYDPLNNINETIIDDDKEILEIYKEFVNQENVGETEIFNSPWIIRFEFNKELMIEHGIIMEDINLALLNYDKDKLEFIYSDDNSKNLIGRLSINANLLGKKSFNGLLDQSDIISIFKNIEHDILNNIYIKGIKNLTNIVMSERPYSIKEYDNESFNIKTVKKWILETDGTNLYDIFNSKYIDYKYTISNDIIEINEILGIEAVRQLLIEEIDNVITEKVNSHHIEILCDVMTTNGFLSPINRQGINKGDIGPLAKCSFEDTTDNLFKAGIFGEKDRLLGVSSNIMMGQTINAGTSMCDILLDEENLFNNLNSSDQLNPIQSVDTIDTIIQEKELKEKDDIHNNYCNQNNFAFSFN